MGFYGKKLKDIRTNKKIFQADLAQKLSVNQATVSGWETGRFSPSNEQIEKLAQILDVDSHDFFDDLVTLKKIDNLNIADSSLLTKYHLLNEDGKNHLLDILNNMLGNREYLA